MSHAYNKAKKARRKARRKTYKLTTARLFKKK